MQNLRTSAVMIGSLFFVGGVCLGGEDKQAESRKKNAEEKTPAASGAPALTTDGLLQMLESMGYEPKILKYQDGSPYYQITSNNYHFTLELSADASKVWFVIFLNKVNEPDKVPGEIWRRLLARNVDIAPAFFVYYETSKYTGMQMPVANQGITRRALREQIDRFVNRVRDNDSVWDTKNWPGGPPSKAEKKEPEVKEPPKKEAEKKLDRPDDLKKAPDK